MGLGLRFFKANDLLIFNALTRKEISSTYVLITIPYGAGVTQNINRNLHRLMMIF